MAATTWCAVGFLTPLLLTIMGGETWGLSFHSVVVMTAGIAGAMVSSSVIFFGVKRELEQVRIEIAGRIPDAEERRSRIRTISISRKLSTAMIGMVATLVVFSMLLTYTRAMRSDDRRALEWQSRAVAMVAEKLETFHDEDASLEEAVGAVVVDASADVGFVQLVIE